MRLWAHLLGPGTLNFFPRCHAKCTNVILCPNATQKTPQQPKRSSHQRNMVLLAAFSRSSCRLAQLCSRCLPCSSRNRSLLWLSNSIVPLGQHTPASSSLFIGFKWWVETSISDGRGGRYPQGKLHVVDDIRAWTKPRLHLLVMSREI